MPRWRSKVKGWFVFPFFAILLAEAQSGASPNAVGQVEILSHSPNASDPDSVAVEDSQGKRAISNMAQVFEKQVILTRDDQTVLLKLNDQTEVSIAPGSQVSVDELKVEGSKTAHMTLLKGMVHLAVTHGYSEKNLFLLRTRSAVMGVRGTEFIVEHRGNGDSSLHTLDGSVAIGKSEEDLRDPSKSYVVPAGQMSTASPKIARPTAPQKFDQKSFSSYLNRRAPTLQQRVETHQETRTQKQIQQQPQMRGPGQNNGTQNRNQPPRPAQPGGGRPPENHPFRGR